MTFTISGLPAEAFADLFGLPDEALQARGILRRTADARPGYPCRITLEDAEPGERVLLLHHESHSAATPYRSSYAIYVREIARRAAHFRGELAPVMHNRPIALRLFDAGGMLVGADMGMNEALKEKIAAALARPDVAYLHAHNAMHGCFVAEIRPAG